MKVVLFCGGTGMRLRGYADDVPKPMVQIGSRPILWHLMKYYAHYGHRDFILCLGYKGNVIKEYFLNYDESVSNDFVWSKGGKQIEYNNRDLHDWTITFVDTGISANLGERLKAVELYLVQPTASFDIVSLSAQNKVGKVLTMHEADVWINGGFFIFRNEIFQFIKPGEELIREPFARLIEKGALMAHKCTGFWQCMDTFKDKQSLDELNQGKAPWKVWTQGASTSSNGTPRVLADA
jgi:glucose-1-phosphate cytidylyltransferase